MYKNSRLDQIHFEEVEKFTRHLDLTKADQKRAAFELEKSFAQKHQPHLKFFMESPIAEITF